MANGQVTTSAQGSFGSNLAVALVGIAIALSQGTVTPQTAQGSVALTGQAITSAAGTITRSQNAPLVGSVSLARQGMLFPNGRSLISAAQGTASPNPQIPLTGQAIVTAQDFIFANKDGTVGPLRGSVITSQQGFALAPGTSPLTGIASTTAAGTLTPVNSPNNSGGQVVTSASGILTPSSGTSVTVNLSGVEITSAQGSLDILNRLTGSASSVAAGTVTPVLSLALVGSEIASGLSAPFVAQDPNDTYILSAAGSFSAKRFDVPLIGTAITGAQGTITATSNVTIALTGSESVSAAGNVTAVQGITVALTGEAMLGEQYNVTAPVPLTGQVITVGQGTVFITSDRTEALIGSAMASGIGSVVMTFENQLLGLASIGGTTSPSPGGGITTRSLTGQAATFSPGTVHAVGGVEVDQLEAVSGEGCSITADVSAEVNTTRKNASGEGCFVTARRAKETRRS